MARTALVLGAQGVLGSSITRELSAAGWQVTRAGRRPEDAADFCLLDLSDANELRTVFSAADVVVNTAHEPDLTPQRTVLRHGGVLIDLTELRRAERAKLAMSEPEGLVVADTGLGGVAYLALAEMLAELPEADAAEYSLMISANGSAGTAGVLLGHGLLTASAHHETALIPFAEPFGVRRCLVVGGDGGDALLRREVGDVPLRHYLCMEPRSVHRSLLVLNRARLIGVLPKALFTSGARQTADVLTEEPICEWVGIRQRGQRLAARNIKGCGYYRMTAAATVVFAEKLANGKKSGTHKLGLRSIDELIALRDVRRALEQRGVYVVKHARAG
jgi:NAD dependent epimerase/dehydratase family